MAEHVERVGADVAHALGRGVAGGHARRAKSTGAGAGIRGRLGITRAGAEQERARKEETLHGLDVTPIQRMIGSEAARPFRFCDLRVTSRPDPVVLVEPAL
jgi:hypothetical protein